MGGLSDIRLRWVLADPARERAVDPLGMGAQADRLADALLPQLSVVTVRARYFSFLCWAVKRSQESGSPLPAIHRLEAELAIEEARRHWNDAPDACRGIVGRTRARTYLDRHDGKAPAHPERLYKSTAFATYRPSMRGLGLLTPKRRPELTTEGRRLASEFADARGRSPRCLGDISAKEQVRLKVLLGLDYRRRTDISAAASRRRATWEAIGQLIADDLSAAEILESYARIGPRAPAVAGTLHRAFVWELLSTGLALAFSLLLEHQRRSVVTHALRAALRRRPPRPRLVEVPSLDDDTATHIVALLRAALGAAPHRLALEVQPAQLAAQLVVRRDPDGFIQQLVHRHQVSKPGEPWIDLSGDRVVPLAPQKTLAFRVRPRSYRIDAFSQLAHDLGMVGR